MSTFHEWTDNLGTRAMYTWLYNPTYTMDAERNEGFGMIVTVLHKGCGITEMEYKINDHKGRELQRKRI